MDAESSQCSRRGEGDAHDDARVYSLHPIQSRRESRLVRLRAALNFPRLRIHPHSCDKRERGFLSDDLLLSLFRNTVEHAENVSLP